MATAAVTLPKTKGGAFLIEDRAAHEIFTPEDLTEEHLAIARTADEFWAKEVEPNIEAIRHQEPGVALKVLRNSAELGREGGRRESQGDARLEGDARVGEVHA